MLKLLHVGGGEQVTVRAMRTRMTRALVTRGLGFIGSFTVDMLIERGHRVRVRDNLERQIRYDGEPPYRDVRVEYIHGDVGHKPSWVGALADVDYIVHSAAAVGVA